ncbi:MAG: cell wall hydrolase [Ruminococcaceae bacterium]|nr:cell wall hydrolase [Oscillospiraceae bacterium]
MMPAGQKIQTCRAAVRRREEQYLKRNFVKRSVILLAAVLLLAAPAAADYDPNADYMAQMLQAACEGDYSAGVRAQQQRAEKLTAEGLSYPAVDFEELMLLSKIIYAEAGSVWLDENWKMAVGEVVLNRMASPEFPNTMREVLEQPGQYYGKNSRYFAGIKPSAACVDAARRLLEGERVLNEPAVVFQSNYRLGSGVFLELRDSALGSTYLCWSSHRELYAS